ncbi:MAG: hypothetical protein NTV49_02355 [Kiritimatiellaeota bacterium]|nr:hypothetical protein [Kiritimatiellota bacterium]
MEVLVALAVLVAIMAIVVSAFSAVLHGWERGRRALDGLHRGEFVMEQLADALHSSMVYGAARKPQAYSFDVVNAGDQVPAGTLSWVTTSSAFLPPRSWLENVPHRLALSVEPQANGQLAFMARAWPYLADTNEVDFTPVFIAPEISGFACQVYNYEAQQWDDTWASSNVSPAQVQITLYVNEAANSAPLVLQRLIEIPLGATNAQQRTRIDMFPPPVTSGGGRSVGGRGGRGTRKARQDAGGAGRGGSAAPPGSGAPAPGRGRGTAPGPGR